MDISLNDTEFNRTYHHVESINACLIILPRVCWRFVIGTSETFFLWRGTRPYKLVFLKICLFKTLSSITLLLSTYLLRVSIGIFHVILNYGVSFSHCVVVITLNKIQGQIRVNIDRFLCKNEICIIFFFFSFQWKYRWLKYLIMYNA